MKRSIFFFLLIPLVFTTQVLTSCCRNEELAEEFSEQPIYPYVGFVPSNWFLSNGIDTCHIQSNYDDRGYEIVEKCSQIIFSYSFLSELNTDQYDIALLISYNSKTNQTSVDISQFTSSSSYSGNDVFDFYNTTSSNEEVQIYFSDVTLQSGEIYTNTSTFYFNSQDTSQHIKKLYIASEVGPVKIEFNSGEVYELISTDKELAPYDYFGFAPK